MSIRRSYQLALAAAVLALGPSAIAQSSNTTDAATTSDFSGAVNNVWKPSLVTDGVYDKIPHINKPLGWAPLRENDILWKKRVWREIDTRQKQNAAFRYPGDENTGGGYFIEILIDAVKRGKIKAYVDDRFTGALTKEGLLEKTVGKTDTTYVIDPDTQATQMKITHSEFNPDLITKYRIKEDVIFDRNEGKVVTRIIGLAPYQDILNEDGSYRAASAMFWLYYPDIRSMLAQYEVFNPDNDVDRMTWDEFFEGRHFASHIIKTTNPFDLTFKEENMSNMEQLYEGQRVQEDLFNRESDMWVY